MRSEQATPRELSLVARALMLGVLLLACALRAYHLDYQSFWSDEGISVQRASLPLAEMLEAMPIEHAPGYFAALRGWIALTGNADYGLRFFSLWPGVLAVALVARLGFDLADPGAGRRAVAVAAAALMATSAFQVWYAQETRMYAWLLAAALASTWALWRILQDERGRRWAALLYAVSTAACVYLHYFGALVPIAHAVYMLGWAAVRRTWQPVLYWLAGAAGALLLFALWMPRTLAVFGFEGWREPGNPAEIPLRYVRAFTVSDAMPPEIARWLLWVYLGVALLGSIWWLARRREAGALLLTTLVIPFAALLLLALRTPDYHERYAIALTMPLTLLVAGGLTSLAPGAWTQDTSRVWAGRGLAAAATVALLALNGIALARHYHDTTQHKPDFRAAAERIMAEQQPGDVILVDGPNPELVFLHYYTGGLPVHDLRGLEGADSATVSRQLEEATAGAARAWELLYFHDPAAVQVWLATQAWATEPTYHNNIRVTLYGIGQGNAALVTHDLAYGTALTLETSTVAPQQVRGGDVLRVTTNWFTHETPPDARFSLRLTNAGGEIVLAQDYVPQNWFAPTPIWLVDRPARDQHGILISQDLPAGQYRLTLRLYDPATGAPIPSTAGDDVTLATVEILP